jgi:hypothetical protein
MEDRSKLPGRTARRFPRRLGIMSLVAALGLALSPGVAHADTFRTATASGHGPTYAAGSAAAQANARAALAAQARQAGEVCPSVTSSASHVYTAPDGSAYVFSGTASGWCVPAPPPPSYTVPRSATRRGEGRTAAAAHTAGNQAASAAILAVGIDCTNWTSSASYVYVAPDGSWHIYDMTVSALCAN